MLYVIHACALIIHIKLRLSITGSALRSHPGMAVPKWCHQFRGQF